MSTKVLHIFPSLEVGGIQRRFATLVNELGDDIHHIVHSMDNCYDALELVRPEIVCTKLKEHAEISPKGSRTLAFRRVLKSVQPDQLCTYNWGAIEWAIANLFPVCPHIHFEDGFGPEEADHQHARRVWARRLVLRHRARVVVPSSQLYNIATGKWLLPASSVRLIPNGVDVHRFQQIVKKEIFSKFSTPTSVFHIGTVTALRPEKNISRLLQAFAAAERPANSHLVIIGDGPEREKLEREAKSLSCSDEIHFLGHQESPEFILPALDLYAVSSDTEQMPISVLEAMASSLPIVSTDVGDVKDMVSPENQYLVSGNTDQALSASISSALVDRGLWGEIGRANHKRAGQEYSLEKMVARHRSLITEKIIP
jgi:glycosyltransferase involved in cell wall biosynthesis